MSEYQVARFLIRGTGSHYLGSMLGVLMVYLKR